MSDRQQHELSNARATIFPPFPPLAEGAGARGWVDALTTWVNATRPARTIKHWLSRRGTILAGGMAYSGLFSSFAALLVFFSVAGIVLANNERLLRQIIDTVAAWIPGLIGPTGVISVESLMNLEVTTSFTIAGVIALVSTLWTALTFLNGARLSIRAMFDLPIQINHSFAARRLLDLALLALFGFGLVVSVALTAASSGIMSWLLNDLFQVELSTLTNVLIRVVSALITMLFDALIVATYLRVLSEVRIPLTTLWQGSLLGGIALAVLKQLGSLLIGGATSNPLLATFAALLGVLIFMNFMCVVLLISAAWCKVTMDDVSQSPRLLTAVEADAIATRTELRARRERLAADRLRLTDALAMTPLGRQRRKLQREYEAVIEEQREVEKVALQRRLGYDPTEAMAERLGLEPDDVVIRRNHDR